MHSLRETGRISLGDSQGCLFKVVSGSASCFELNVFRGWELGFAAEVWDLPRRDSALSEDLVPQGYTSWPKSLCHSESAVGRVDTVVSQA